MITKINRAITTSAALVLLMLGIASCENRERVFPDFEYTAAYFPYQYPVRTLILGDYVFDNSNDNQQKFVISAGMGGVYENKENRTVEFVVDNALVENLTLNGKKILALPTAYYTLSDPSRIIIPKGKLSGGVEVQLTDAFFQDSAAVGHLGVTYVLPLRIVSATTDSVLKGKPIKPRADPRVAGDWEVVPLNYTLFGVNYVNEFHGKYLLRGQSEVRAANLVETNVYRDKYVERDEVVDVNTVSRRGVVYRHRIVRSVGKSPGDFEMAITFDEAGNGKITQTKASDFPVEGTAKFVKNAEAWGGKKHPAIYLDYKVIEGKNVHTAKDTLVFRDKAVSFQEFEPKVSK